MLGVVTIDPRSTTSPIVAAMRQLLYDPGGGRPPDRVRVMGTPRARGGASIACRSIYNVVGGRMNYRRMGRWGLKLSEISFGAWLTFGDDVDEKSAERMLHLAYDKGINFYDNADVYQGGRAEEVMGAAMRGLPRTALVVSSKVFWRTLPGPNGQ